MFWKIVYRHIPLSSLQDHENMNKNIKRELNADNILVEHLKKCVPSMSEITSHLAFNVCFQSQRIHWGLHLCYLPLSPHTPLKWQHLLQKDVCAFKLLEHPCKHTLDNLAWQSDLCHSSVKHRWTPGLCAQSPSHCTATTTIPERGSDLL